MKQFPVQLIVLMNNPRIAANSVKQLMAVAKTKPGELNHATDETGLTTHMET